MLQSIQESLVDIPIENEDQLSLFPFDPWPGVNPVATLYRPYPGVCRVVVAPLLIGGQEIASDDETVHYLAVSDDGWHVACGDVTYAQLSQEGVWDVILSSMNRANEPVAF